jgi:stress response protein YsnF
LGGRGRQISEFEASLVYKVSSRTARTIQRNPVSKNQTKNKTKKINNNNNNNPETLELLEESIHKTLQDISIGKEVLK